MPSLASDVVRTGVKLMEERDAHAVYAHTPSQLPNEIPHPGMIFCFTASLTDPSRLQGVLRPE